MIGVAGDAGYIPTVCQWHIAWNGHGWGYFNRMGKTIVCLFLVAGKVLMASAAGGANPVSVGQLFSLKGQRLVTVEALGVSLVVMDGKGWQGQEQYRERENSG
jgi:hypothetical protein